MASLRTDEEREAVLRRSVSPGSFRPLHLMTTEELRAHLILRAHGRLQYAAGRRDQRLNAIFELFRDLASCLLYLEDHGRDLAAARW